MCCWQGISRPSEFTSQSHFFWGRRVTKHSGWRKLGPFFFFYSLLLPPSLRDQWWLFNRSRRKRSPVRPGTYVHVTGSLQQRSAHVWDLIIIKLKGNSFCFPFLINAGPTKGQAFISIFWSGSLNSPEMFLLFKGSRFSANVTRLLFKNKHLLLLFNWCAQAKQLATSHKYSCLCSTSKCRRMESSCILGPCLVANRGTATVFITKHVVITSEVSWFHLELNWR